MAFDSLPDVVLRKCFKYLAIKDMLSAHEVCKSWQAVLNDSFFWNILYLTASADAEVILTALNQFGHHTRSICFQNSQINEWFCSILSLLSKTYKINWLHVSDVEILIKVIGLMNDPDCIPTLRSFMCRCTQLTRFVFHDAVIACAPYMLVPDPVAHSVLHQNSTTLTHLELVNYTMLKYTRCLEFVGECCNLQRIILSPQHLSSEILKKLSKLEALTSLSLMCTCFTPYNNCYILSNDEWQQFHKAAPKVKLEVFLLSEDRKFITMLQNPSLRVASLKVECKYLSLISFSQLAGTLEELVVAVPHHFSKESKQFAMDESQGMVQMADIIKQCPKLVTIGYGCSVTCNILLIWMDSIRANRSRITTIDLTHSNVYMSGGDISWNELCQTLCETLAIPSWAPLSIPHFQRKHNLLACSAHRHQPSTD